MEEKSKEKQNIVILDNKDPNHRSRIILNVPYQPFNRYWGHEGDKRLWVPLESAVNFNFVALVQRIRKYLKDKNPKITNDEIRDKTAKSLLKFTLNKQSFDYTYITYKLGGDRWYIICPKCGVKTIRLFLPDSTDREKLYLCRWCHKLKPLSLIFSTNPHYKGLVKPLKELENIKAKLLKKTVKSKDVESLLDRYEELQDYLAKSPEYRLWKFKREHGKYF